MEVREVGKLTVAKALKRNLEHLFPLFTARNTIECKIFLEIITVFQSFKPIHYANTEHEAQLKRKYCIKLHRNMVNITQTSGKP